jgi:2Fe-2S iron-sulfur cluster binding domain
MPRADRPPFAADDRRVHDHPLLGPLPPAPAVPFTFDGRPLAARGGEPIAAALLANGVRVFRTMPRSGEARGGWCLVGRCPDCLVIVDGRPNVRACVTPVVAGMRVATQHGLGDDGSESSDERARDDRSARP